MPQLIKRAELAAARFALREPLHFDAFLNKLRVAERNVVQKHAEACAVDGADPRHRPLWERLVSALFTLAPELPKLGAKQSVQFYVPDGKYKLQVFALRDTLDGKIHVYCRDVAARGVEVGLLGAAGAAAGVEVEEIDGAEIESPEAHLKPMLGWGRKVTHFCLPDAATAAQVEAVEALCAMSAAAWGASGPAGRVAAC